MTDEKKDSIFRWLTTISVGDAGKIIAMLCLFFKMGAIWTVFIGSYNTMNDNIINIKQDVIEIKADHAILRSNITMLNDSLSSYEQRRTRINKKY